MSARRVAEKVVGVKERAGFGRLFETLQRIVQSQVLVLGKVRQEVIIH